jgi:hypothetical protein
MANWYINSASTGNQSGTSWANAAAYTAQLTGLPASTITSTASAVLNFNTGVPSFISTAMFAYDRTNSSAIKSGQTVLSVSSIAVTLSANIDNPIAVADQIIFTLSSVAPAIAAGDSFYYANNSAESYSPVAGTAWAGGGLNFSFPGTSSNPNRLYSCTTANTPPQTGDLTAGASLTMSSTNSVAFVPFGNGIFCYGLTIAITNQSGGLYMTSNASDSGVTYDTCTFDLSGQGGGGLNAQAASSLQLLNCSFKFGGTAQSFGALNFVNMKNCKVIGTFQPTHLFNGNDVGLVCEGCDFSLLGAGKTIMPSGGGNTPGFSIFKDCKVNASVTLASTPGSAMGERIAFIRCAATAADNQFALYTYSGTENNNTSVYRSGGSADFSGNGFSKQLTTTANCSWAPIRFETLPISIVNTLVGSTRTVTVYGVWDSPYGANTAPNNDDIWIEVEYPVDSGDPLGGYVNSTKANYLASGVALSTDASSWSGTGGFTHATGFKMSVTLTAQIAGPLTIRVYCGKASTTFYVDATAVLS